MHTRLHTHAQACLLTQTQTQTQTQTGRQADTHTHTVDSHITGHGRTHSIARSRETYTPAAEVSLSDGSVESERLPVVVFFVYCADPRHEVLAASERRRVLLKKGVQPAQGGGSSRQQFT
jgi:hypothetical protein